MHKNRKSNRLKNWDYRNEGSYFITICTKDRTHFFGEIQQRKMNLSPCGVIANVLWSELEHRNKNVSLGEFVVMPNHIHGIIQLNQTILDENDTDITCRVVASNVPTCDDKMHNDVKNNTQIDNKWMSAISPKPNSISTIIRSYKSAVTKHCNRLKLQFEWQSRFYDHIIRNEQSFQKISEYITDNPTNWKEDRFFK